MATDFTELIYSHIFETKLHSEELMDIMPDDADETLQTVMACLKEKESDVLHKYYEENMTYKEIGDFHGVTPERIKQIKAKAIKKMQHPRRTMLLRNGLEYYNDKVIEKEIKVAEKPNMEQIDSDKGIETLDLSTRSYNALKRYGCHTVLDLLAKKEDELLAMRNMGKKSVWEVVSKVHTCGYTFEWEA